MTTEKRKHLAAWFSIIFIFVTLASLFYIVKEENHKCTGEDCPVCACVVRYLCGYRNFVIHTCRNTGWLDYRGCRYGSILYQLCSRTDDGEKMI